MNNDWPAIAGYVIFVAGCLSYIVYGARKEIKSKYKPWRKSE